MFKRLAVSALIAAVFFSLGFVARPSFSRLKLRSRVALSKTKPIVFLGDSRVEWGDWSELLDRCDVSNRGISGDTTSGVLKRLPSSVPTPKVVCVIQLGVNDFFLGASVSHVVENYRRILDHLVRQKQARVIVTSIILAGQNQGLTNR